MIKQSSFKYWDRSVADFDGIYSGEGRTLLGRWLDRWLRRDIYVGVAEITRLINELGAGADRIGSVPERRGCPCRWRVPAAGVIGIDFSKEMLRKAERVTRDAGMHDRCHFLHADILQNLPEALNRHKPYDAVAILGVFEYMSDPLPVLRTARQFEPQRIVASLPRSGTFRSTLRHSTSLKFLPNPNMLLRWPAVDSSSS